MDEIFTIGNGCIEATCLEMLHPMHFKPSGNQGCHHMADIGLEFIVMQAWLRQLQG